MEPLAPVAKVVGFSPGVEILLAVLLGAGFGFALEQGGLANPRILAGQWFGYNFAVLRVMFTGIVVASLGLFGLHYAGLLDFNLVYVNPTFLWPQLVGGLIFGFGFAIGQHCPGTAVIAVGTGNLDAISYVIGFLGGALVFAFAQPLFADFYESGSLGRFVLPDLLGLPAGVVVLAVVAMAVGAFAFTHLLDRKLGATTPGETR